MSDTQLTIFTEEAVDLRVRRLQDATSAPHFMAELENLKNFPNSTMDIDWEFRTETPVLGYSKKGNSLLPGLEAENAIKVFEYLGDMTPVEASDRRLWSYLSTVTFLDYTTHRWPLDIGPWKNRVGDRWLIQRASRTELIRNSISRLWWAAKLTSDTQLQRPLSKGTSDPYAYLRAAIEKEDRFIAVFDRDTGMVPELRFAVLEHLQRNPAYTSEKYVREFIKEVVLVTGYRELAGLNAGQLNRLMTAISEQLDPILIPGKTTLHPPEAA
jgi:hypothetical protein